jgi:type II secretory pathway pseudopilin PulG
MTTHHKKSGIRRRGERGLTMVEIVIVLFVIMVIAAIVVPNVLSAVANMRLRASAGDLAGLMQQARILAAKNNTTYAIKYGTRNGASIAYVDLNANGSFDVGEPVIEFSGTTVPASGAPSGSGGQPSQYVLSGDTGSGSYDNTNTLGYTGRGLPCNYDTTTNPPTCTTPPAKYFTYYLKETRSTGTAWAGVVVTKSGRAKMIVWNGTAWD